MDNGQVIPGLNEDWTLAGAKLMEWVAGLATALIFSELFLENAVRQAPLLIMVTVGTPFLLAGIRRSFPDEERGMRNRAMVAMGFTPPDLAAPASIQPEWSGAPLRELNEECEFTQLGLAHIFAQENTEEQ